jgi:hypothetical protein
MVSRTFLVLWLLIVAACSSTQTQPPAETSPQRPPPPETTSEQQRDSAASASAGLLSRAEQAQQAGDYDGAQALLQRAQRIDARNAEVYLALARLHLVRGDEAGATAMAERGMLYCQGGSCERLRRFIEP